MSQETVVPEQDENVPVEPTTVEKTTEAPAEAVQPQQEPEVKEAEVEAPAPVERKVYTMPVVKAQKEKQRAVEKAREEARAEYDAKLAEMKSQQTEAPTSEQKRDAIREAAEKHGLEYDAAKDLLEAFKAELPTPNTPDLSKYDAILQERELEDHRRQVAAEFDEKVVPMILAKHPGATQEHIRDVKDAISGLAFTEGFNTYRIEDIYRVKADEFTFKNQLSAETSGPPATDIQEFTVLSPEEENALADRDFPTFVRYTKWLTGKHSQYIN